MCNFLMISSIVTDEDEIILLKTLSMRVSLKVYVSLYFIYYRQICIIFDMYTYLFHANVNTDNLNTKSLLEKNIYT